MRTPALILLLAVAASPALAAHSNTVAQLDQQLNALRAKPDAEAAYLIADLRLTERLSAARLAQQAIKDGIPVEESLPKIPPGDSLRVIVIDENSQSIGTITWGPGTPAAQ